MSTVNPPQTRGTCFVVMGFGKKTDFETGRVLDLDASYNNLIKPAVEAAGLKCVRADEIVHSGLIDVPMYEQLLNADVVVADLSTSNKNAFYELGIRHALRPYTTVIIAEDGIKTFPFDVNHIVVRQYRHMGEDIGVSEARRFTKLLTDAIIEIQANDPRNSDSPVYTFLRDLTPPILKAVAQADEGALGGPTRGVAALAENAAAAGSGQPAEASHGDAAPPSTHSMLMQQVDEAQKRGDWLTAKNGLSFVRGMMKTQAPDRPEDPYIIQRHALVTYKSKHPTEEAALREAREVLQALDPEISNDTETLGLWGSVHKRLWEITRDRAYLDTAVRAYERGFFLRNDYYNGINLAFLLNVRAANATDPAEAVADFVQARRVRQEVLEICRQWLQTNAPDPQQAPAKDLYWVLATMGEAHVGLGEDAEGEKRLQEAYAMAPEPWMQGSTEEQIGKLRPMLADSPLKHLRSDAAPAV